MLDILLPMSCGFGFVCLGRWIYRNPNKVYPNWAYSNPDHPLLIGFVRVFATMLLVVGSFAAIASVGSRVLPTPVVFLVAVAGSIAVAWFGRPSLGAKPSADDLASSEHGNQQTAHTSFLSKKGKWVLGVAFGVAVIFVISVFISIGDSEVSQLAVKQAQDNGFAAENLGVPMKRGFFISGAIETAGPSGHADISIPMSGPRGKGTLYAVAIRSAGVWKFQTLELAIDGRSARLDLLTAPTTEQPLPR